MAEEKVRKTTAKKTAVRRTTTKVTPSKTAARTTASGAVRKAPARQMPAASVRAHRSSKTLVVVLLAVIIVAGVSAGIGFSDTGAIDVASKIEQRKQNATPEEQERFEAVPVQHTQTNVPNGGLVGTGKSVPAPVPEPPAATTSASTTAETASTTEDMAVEMPGEETTAAEGSAVSDETPVAQ